MMDLEIADYERTVKTLYSQVADRDAKIQALQEDIERMEEQRQSLQKLLGQ
jgi:peptidoglycan hydrolase CwlO-like protein